MEFEQTGKDRAKYVARLLETLAEDLSTAGVRGLTPAVLRSCRLAYQIYPQIRQTMSVEFLDGAALLRIRGTPTRESPAPLELGRQLQLSWRQFQELVCINDPWKHAIYEDDDSLRSLLFGSLASQRWSFCG